MRYVQSNYHVSALRQLRDIALLKFNRNMGPGDYYLYAMFDKRRFPDDASKLTYGGWRLFDDFRRFSNRQFQAIAHKHTLYRLLESFGLPVPRILAIYAPKPDSFERHRALIDLEELEAFLRQDSNLPFFGKPSNASSGYGCLAVTNRDVDSVYRLLDGRRLTLAEVKRFIHSVAMSQGTYLLTELLHPRDDFRRMCGKTVASLRVVMLVRDGNPEIFRAAALIPRQGQQTSNALGLSTGTVMGSIDKDSGIVSEVLSSLGPDYSYSPVHPDTGVRIEGFRIEGWSDVVSVLREASQTEVLC